MRFVNIFNWEAVKQWCGVMFLGTGGLWLAGGIVNEVHRQQVLDDLAGVHTGDIALIVILSAMIGTFGALLGLYPRVAERAPRLALAGLVIGGFTAGGNAILLLLGATVATVPASRALVEIAGVSEGLKFMWGVGLVLYPVGSALFGIGSLRTDILSQSMGYLLLVPIVLWAGVLGSLILEQLVVEQNLTGGMGTIIAVLMAAAFVLIGYLLHTGAAHPTRTEPSSS